jgi:hypothetical protein
VVIVQNDLMRQEDFERQSYEVRRGQTRAYIETVLTFVEDQGQPPDSGRYDLLSGAMSSFQDRNFWSALVALQPVMQPTEMVAPTPNLLNAPEPDRSMPLRERWQTSQSVLERLEKAELQ